MSQNTRKVYILTHGKDDYPEYKLIPWMDLKIGDVFTITEEDGRPVPNRNGTLLSVATEEPTIQENGSYRIVGEEYEVKPEV